MAEFEDHDQTLDQEIKELSGDSIKYTSFSAENFGVVLVSSKESQEEGGVKGTRHFKLNNFTQKDGDWCMQNLERSYFSHKNEKTYDDNVRLSVSTKTFFIEDWDILERYLIGQLQLWGNYHIEPYKFNCYGIGSFFQKHVDTPSAGMLGTLIVIPNSRFSGGELVFSDFFNPNKFDFAKAIVEKLNDKIVQCVYFDKYKEHKVSKVTEGFRCSLVFKVLEKNFFSKNSSDSAKIIKKNFCAATVNKDFCKSAANKCFEFYKDKMNILVSTEACPEDFLKELKNLFKNYKKVYHLGDEAVPEYVHGSFNPPRTEEDIDEYFNEDFLEDYADDLYPVHFVLGSDDHLFDSENYEFLSTGFTGNSPTCCRTPYPVKTGLLLNPQPTDNDSSSNDE